MKKFERSYSGCPIEKFRDRYTYPEYTVQGYFKIHTPYYKHLNMFHLEAVERRRSPFRKYSSAVPSTSFRYSNHHYLVEQ